MSARVVPVQPLASRHPYWVTIRFVLMAPLCLVRVHVACVCARGVCVCVCVCV